MSRIVDESTTSVNRILTFATGAVQKLRYVNQRINVDNRVSVFQ